MPTETSVWLSLGSNIRPCDNLRAALRLLRAACTLERCSPVYRTAPRGDSDQANFLNMAVRLRTTHTPAGFHREVIQRIEACLGRERDPQNRNAARTIDIDIAFWGDKAFQFGDPPRQVPDPDILLFPHVALPLAAIAPDKRHLLTGQALDEIARQLGTEGIQRLTLNLDDGADAHSP